MNGGRITGAFKAAVREHGLKTFYGDNASRQPGNLQDILLHETSVSWIRRREGVTQTRQPWTETVDEFGRRLRGICQHINDKHDVEGLCHELPGRLQKLLDAEGDRIPK